MKHEKNIITDISVYLKVLKFSAKQGERNCANEDDHIRYEKKISSASALIRARYRNQDSSSMFSNINKEINGIMDITVPPKTTQRSSFDYNYTTEACR